MGTIYDRDGIFMAVKSQQGCFMRVCLLTNVPEPTLKHSSLPQLSIQPKKTNQEGDSFESTFGVDNYIQTSNFRVIGHLIFNFTISDVCVILFPIDFHWGKCLRREDQ